MPKNLLLADDSATIRKVVEICFSQEDVAVTGAASADDALAKARARHPDVIVIDTFMPGKSGYDLAAAIRADATLANTPILLLASPNEPFNEARAQQLRVDAWIPKPFQSAALIDQVKRLLSGARPSAPPPARPAAAPPAAPRPPAPAAAPRPATAPPPARPAAIVPPPPPPRPAAPAVATGGQRPVAPAPAALPRPGAPPPPRPPGAPAAVVAPPRPPAGAPGPVAAGTGVPPRPAAPAAARPPAPAAPAAAQQLTAQNHAALLKEAITKATRDMIEKVVWEVVPELAEAMIKERLDKLAKERGDLG